MSEKDSSWCIALCPVRRVGNLCDGAHCTAYTHRYTKPCKKERRLACASAVGFIWRARSSSVQLHTVLPHTCIIHMPSPTSPLRGARREVLHGWIDRSAARARSRIALLQPCPRGTTWVVRSPRELASLPYSLQGDPDLHTEEAFVQRKRLRRHPRIVNELERWWAAILRCNERDGAITVPAIHFDVYSAMIKRLYMELVDEYDEADACATSHEDWEADSQGHPSLDRARFHDCIFEVADQYVRDLGADDYISFLSDLYTKIFDSNDRLRGWWPNEHSDDGDDDDDVFSTQGPVAHPSGRCALGSSRKWSRDQTHAVRSSPAPAPSEAALMPLGTLNGVLERAAKRSLAPRPRPNTATYRRLSARASEEGLAPPARPTLSRPSTAPHPPRRGQSGYPHADSGHGMRRPRTRASSQGTLASTSSAPSLRCTYIRLCETDPTSMALEPALGTPDDVPRDITRTIWAAPAATRLNDTEGRGQRLFTSSFAPRLPSAPGRRHRPCAVV